MTQKQAIKHKEVIKWWLDNLDKGVWLKDIDSGWLLITTLPSFDINNIYVQNDEYTEYRKALADRKIIQYCSNLTQGQVDLHSIYSTGVFQSQCKYRIKPSELDFKIGDWVIYEDSSILQIESIEILVHKIGNDVIFQNKGLKLPLKYAKKWKPQKDEWCVFWNEYNESYNIAKFEEKTEFSQYSTKNNVVFRNVFPLEFIDILKDK